MPRTSLRRTKQRLCAVIALAALSGGCAMPKFLSQPPQTRGNKVDPDQLAQLVPGTSTRSDVSALLGSPTARASFDDNQWLYIDEVTTPVIAGTNAVRSQQVYVVSFDNNGVLQGVTRKTLKDSQPVQFVQRTTPTPGSSASILQQLLGNVGTVGPVGGLGDSGQGSSSNPGNF